MCKLKICHAIYKYNVGVIVWQSLIMEIYIKKNVCCHELKPTIEKKTLNLKKHSFHYQLYSK